MSRPAASLLDGTRDGRRHYAAATADLRTRTTSRTSTPGEGASTRIRAPASDARHEDILELKPPLVRGWWAPRVRDLDTVDDLVQEALARHAGQRVGMVPSEGVALAQRQGHHIEVAYADLTLEP